jgi:prevent-host-death family protein
MDEEARSRPKKINAMKVRQNFGTMLEEVFYRGDIYIVERAGKPMAAVIPLSDLEVLQKLQGRPKTEPDTITESKRRRKQGKS